MRALSDFWERMPGSPATDAAIEPLTLDRKHVYIFPNRAGRTYMVMLGVVLIGAINYNNSLGYGFTFLFASLYVVALLHTYRNLAGLRYGGGRCAPVYTGDIASFNLNLDNRGQSARYAIALKPAPDAQRWYTEDEQTSSMVQLDVSADDIKAARIDVRATRRGWLTLRRVEIQTRFPLGLFTAWSYWRPPLRVLVYPRPAGPLALPGSAEKSDNDEGGRQPGTDDFAGFRDYRPGDSPRHIAWKALAREQGLHVKRFAGGQTDEIILKLADAALLPDLEQRLSQLCKWVLMAEAAGLSYGLELPGKSILPGQGAAQREQCLRALALFGLP
ncbi:MAG TPA: DUF58 domain-containing protein [Gammaproteobacteria bacterium]|nr:DUF58 domain-containing protein [Gammaproteobacteria bacterium]